MEGGGEVDGCHGGQGGGAAGDGDGGHVLKQKQYARLSNEVQYKKCNYLHNVGHLNTNPNLYVKYQNPSSSRSQDIVLTRFLHCYYGRVEKGA